MSKRIQSPEAKQLLREHSCCELCGDKRNLEVHHIIPVVCGGSDNINNLIVVCGVCHSKLTPKGELSKIGINKLRVGDTLRRMELRYYELAGELMFEEDEFGEKHLTGIDWPDVFDELIKEFRNREKRLKHEV